MDQWVEVLDLEMDPLVGGLEMVLALEMELMLVNLPEFQLVVM